LRRIERTRSTAGGYAFLGPPFRWNTAPVYLVGPGAHNRVAPRPGLEPETCGL